jgi:hypothetical protein
MTTYARIVQRRLTDGTYRYRFETQDISAGEPVATPVLTDDRLALKDSARCAATERRLVVVDSWDEALRREGVHVENGAYCADKRAGKKVSK